MNKKPVNIDEQRTEALVASLSSTGLDAFSISRFLKLLAEGGSAGPIKILRRHRLDLLEEIHSKQKSLDLICLLYTSPSPRDRSLSRMPSSA